jgi:hypothetical protein
MKVWLICLISTVSLAVAQTSLPSPESYFGFPVGEYHLRPDQITDYLKALAQASDRITIEQYGETYEKRPLLLLTITSPENQKHIQEIKERHRALSDPLISGSLDVKSMPVVVWLGYSVHGNEASGSNAAVQVAYYLASAREANIDQLLSNTVILLDPMINPDGLGRFSQWVNSHRGKTPNADPANREHAEAWPGGRSNHYWFDLNRDYMPLQHPESRGRMVKYYEWLPNVLNDHHEMGTNSTFFFQPGVAGRTNPNVPKRVEELTRAIARFHAKALDQTGSLYYTREDYDDFYVGKGSSYPDVTGCVGILYEQASSRGSVQESVHGNLTFAATLRNHYTTSLSVLQAAESLRTDLLTYQRDFFTSALKEAALFPIKAYVFGSPADAARNYSLLDILCRHQIEVYELGKQVQASGRTFEPSSSYVIPMSQKQFRLINALFERRTAFTDSLFYDISSWTLPLAFNLPYAELKALPRDLTGKRIERPAFPKGEIVPGANPVAYVFDWKSYYAPRALYRLQKAGIRTRVATKPFETTLFSGKERFDYGTIMVPLGIQREKSESIARTLQTIAREDGIKVYGLPTGMSVEGSDLGSSTFAPLQTPQVMLVVGAGVASTDIGEAWHLLDQRFGMEVSLVETQSVGRVDLNRYTAIVMAGGSYAAIDSGGVASLRRWVESGGTLIAMEQAAEWAVNNRLATARLRRFDRGHSDSLALRRPYGDAQRYAGALSFDGAIFETIGDRTHPLLFGYEEDHIPVFKGNTIFMEPSQNPYATPLVYTASPLVSGYMHRDFEPLLKNSACIVVSGLRSGRVILMAENPNFRAIWYGTNRLFLNGIFFGSLLRQGPMRSEE